MSRRSPHRTGEAATFTESFFADAGWQYESTSTADARRFDIECARLTLYSTSLKFAHNPGRRGTRSEQHVSVSRLQDAMTRIHIHKLSPNDEITCIPESLHDVPDTGAFEETPPENRCPQPRRRPPPKPSRYFF